jgi:hypothetical protein
MDPLLGTFIVMAPAGAKLLALVALLLFRTRTHNALFALLAFTLTSETTLALWPEIWSVPGYVIENGASCALITAVAIEAGRRAPGWKIVSFQVLMIELSAIISGLIIDKLFSPVLVIRQIAGVHFAAGATAGVVVQQSRIDPLSRDVLQWLFVTRIAQATRLALYETGPQFSVWAGGVATVAMCVACYWTVHHCVSDPGDDANGTQQQSSQPPPPAPQHA